MPYHIYIAHIGLHHQDEEDGLHKGHSLAKLLTDHLIIPILPKPWIAITHFHNKLNNSSTPLV